MRSSLFFKNLLFIVICISSCFACDKSDANENTVCYFFDQRQCAGDDWAEIIAENQSWTERERAMKSYFESKDIEVEDLFIEPLFHEAVCEACFVCPEQHRFFIKISEECKNVLEGLELLNLGEGACEDLFN